MDIVEIEGGLEVCLSGTGEEIQAAVEAKDVVGLGHNCRDRGHDHDVVIAAAAGNLP